MPCSVQCIPESGVESRGAGAADRLLVQQARCRKGRPVAPAHHLAEKPEILLIGYQVIVTNNIFSTSSVCLGVSNLLIQDKYDASS